MCNGDSSGYYIHLVSIFINDDVGDYSESTDKMIENFPCAKGLIDDPFWLKETEIGRKSIKYTLGVAIMEMPSFLLAHIYTKFDARYASDGWSKPYILAINISKVIYILIGIYFLIPILLNYFSHTETALTILGITLGTNLFFHVPNLTMAHPFLFFDFCMLIYFTSKFYKKPSYFSASMIGFLLGLIAITRVPEILAIAIPVFWGVYDYKTLKVRFNFFVKKYMYFLVALVCLIVMLAPQIFYWHYVSGQFLFNSYEGEGFDFLSPDFGNAFFSFSNGWLIYTPLMIFSILGILHLPKVAPKVILPLVLFVGLNSWVHFSYYVVNYFPGLGSRPMIESYPLLAFGLAAFFAFCSRKYILRFISRAILVLFIALNIFQTIQSKKGVLFSENMNPTYFWEIFGRLNIDLDSVKEFDSNQDQPNEKDIELVERLFFEDFEDSIDINYNRLYAFSGKLSYQLSNAFQEINYEGKFGDLELEAGDYINAGVHAYRKNEDFVSSQYDLEHLLVEFIDESGKTRKRTSIKIGRYIGNSNNSIFHTGKTDIWGEANFYVKIPKESNADWKLKVMFLNASSKKLFIDDLRIDRYSVKG
jgi:hypothetical protein